MNLFCHQSYLLVLAEVVYLVGHQEYLITKKGHIEKKKTLMVNSFHYIPPKGLSGPSIALAGLALELCVRLEVNEPPLEVLVVFGTAGC